MKEVRTLKYHGNVVEVKPDILFLYQGKDVWILESKELDIFEFVHKQETPTKKEALRFFSKILISRFDVYKSINFSIVSSTYANYIRFFLKHFKTKD